MTMPTTTPVVSPGTITDPGGGLGQIPGVTFTSAEGVAGAGAGAGLDSGVGLLAVTGAGPGTLLLALAGIASVVAGGFMALTGRRMNTRNSHTAGLPDLSHLAHARA